MKISTLLLGMLCIFSITMAQDPTQKAIYPTPLPADTWNFVQYGNFNTNPYTGTVGVDIPIYTYQDPDFKFPISLHYGSNGMVPNRTPGIVGHDWNLSIGGVITRTVRGIPDDAPYNGDQESWISPFMLGSPVILKPQGASIKIGDVYGYTNVPGTPQNTYGFAHLHRGKITPVSDVDAVNRFFPTYVFSKSLTEPLITLYGKYKSTADVPDLYRSPTFYVSGHNVGIQTPEAEFYDIQPDVFHFNVCGYSGDFVMGLNEEVKVYNTNVPSGEISVAFEIDPLDGNNSDKYFWGGWARIVIKVGDGTQFTFENSERWRRTVEFQNLNVLETSGSNSRDAWYLSSIKAHNGRQITFDYGTSREPSSSRIPPLGGVRYWIDSDNGYYTPTDFTSQYIPLLKKVVIGTTEISLTYGTFNNNKYVESLIIKQGSKEIKRTNLNYINQYNGKSLNRNFLRSVSISGEGKYQMEYMGIDSSLPVDAPQEGTLRLDHWGYYNAKSEYIAAIPYNRSGEEVIDARYHNSAPDSVSASFGMLSKMKWPTGGYTKYIYQAHRYDKVIALDKVGTDEYKIGEVLKDYTPKLPSRIVGGLRVKKIENYDRSDVLTGFKEYQYKTGLLCKEPFHVGMFEMVAAPGAQLLIWDLTNESFSGWLVSGNIVVSGQMISSDFNQVGQNHIVYPDVSEINADGSYTRYEYLSFLNSAWQNFKNEKRAIQTLEGERLDSSFYAKRPSGQLFAVNGLYNRNACIYQKLMWKSSVNDLGFGQPNIITSYNASNQIVSKKSFTYNYSTSKNTLWYPQTPLAGPDKTYINLMKPTIAENSWLVRESETIYYTGNINVNKETSYMYNESHQMTRRYEKSSSSADVFQTNYFYPKDYVVDSPSPISGGMKTVYNYPSTSIGTISKTIVDKNVVNKPLSVNQMVNGNRTQRTDYTYVQSGDLINISKIKQISMDGQELITYVDYYDKQGRPLQVRYPDGKVETIVWGYGGRLVAAKIENKTKAQVESLIGSLQDPLAGTLDYQKEKMLRGVSDAYVTTYEYSDGVGISRITQPDGTSAFFVYNKDGKLVGTFDKDGNPVSSANYNIQY